MENNEFSDGCQKLLLNNDQRCREVLYQELCFVSRAWISGCRLRRKRRLRSIMGVYMPPTSSQHLLNTFARQENASRCLCSQESADTSNPNTSYGVTPYAVFAPSWSPTLHVTRFCSSEPRDSRLAPIMDGTASRHPKCFLLSQHDAF